MTLFTSSPLLFAHRGASRHAPENTLEAFDLAMRVGAHVLELDVHLTLDHRPVVIHDATLERTTNGIGPVMALNYEQLRRFDAGYHFTTADGVPRFRNRGISVPLLEEVLRAFPARGFQLAFNIEIKQPHAVKHVLDVLMRVGNKDVLLTAANDSIMREIEAAQPGCTLGLSHGQVRDVLKRVYLRQSLQQYSHRALQVPLRVKRYLPVVTQTVLEATRAAQIPVHIWTVNDFAKAQHWLKRGVNGVMTDDPALLASLF